MKLATALEDVTRDEWESWKNIMENSTRYRRARRLGPGLPSLFAVHDLSEYELEEAEDVATVVEYMVRSTGEDLDERERVVRGRMMANVLR